MSENEMPQEPRRRKKRANSAQPVFIIFLILLLFIVIGAGIFFLTAPEKPTDSILSGEPQKITLDQFGPAEKTGTTSESENERQALPEVDQTESQHVDEPGLAGPIVPDETNDLEKECTLLAGKLHGFFSHINTEEYIKPFELNEPSQSYFTSLAYRLLDNPPVVSRESDDLYTILKNMAHFFRVIGKDNILLMKTILDRERDKIEDVASELYQWTSIKSCRNDQFQFTAPLAKMYEYAGFFLNTMGGRSYLFRRDSRSRLLVNYYSILIVENANEKEMNRHGIDISLLIPQLINEIEFSNQLIYKENYLDQLYNLLEKYQ